MPWSHVLKISERLRDVSSSNEKTKVKPHKNNASDFAVSPALSDLHNKDDTHMIILHNENKIEPEAEAIGEEIHILNEKASTQNKILEAASIEGQNTKSTKYMCGNVANLFASKTLVKQPNPAKMNDAGGDTSNNRGYEYDIPRGALHGSICDQAEKSNKELLSGEESDDVEAGNELVAMLQGQEHSGDNLSSLNDDKFREHGIANVKNVESIWSRKSDVDLLLAKLHDDSMIIDGDYKEKNTNLSSITRLSLHPPNDNIGKEENSGEVEEKRMVENCEGKTTIEHGMQEVGQTIDEGCKNVASTEMILQNLQVDIVNTASDKAGIDEGLAELLDISAQSDFYAIAAREQRGEESGDKLRRSQQSLRTSTASELVQTNMKFRSSSSNNFKVSTVSRIGRDDVAQSSRARFKKKNNDASKDKESFGAPKMLVPAHVLRKKGASSALSLV